MSAGCLSPKMALTWDWLSVHAGYIDTVGCGSCLLSVYVDILVEQVASPAISSMQGGSGCHAGSSFLVFASRKLDQSETAGIALLTIYDLRAASLDTLV